MTITLVPLGTDYRSRCSALDGWIRGHRFTTRGGGSVIVTRDMVPQKARVVILYDGARQALITGAIPKDREGRPLD